MIPKVVLLTTNIDVLAVAFRAVVDGANKVSRSLNFVQAAIGPQVLWTAFHENPVYLPAMGPSGGRATATWGADSQSGGDEELGPNGPQGGVFPVEPSPKPVPVERDSLCIQALSEVGAANGVIIYRVEAASCEANPNTICIPGCTGTVGSTVVGIDIIGLLG